MRILPALNSFAHWRKPRPTSDTSNPHGQTLSTPSTLHLAPGEVDEGQVQVSVLVAMPSPKSKSLFNLDEDAEVEMIPEIMVGVVELPYHAGSRANVSTSKLEGGV
jgi:hypothetical protein